ncbi:hypothetical protein CYD26_04575 [Pseudomonas sp. FFUP_PS_473]|jgi:hypothetical protein|uniref:DUF1302 domain-containing protein n=1 Tax=unclassified Pseudomonas TaxID=196821 RepID=UPI000C7C34DD|nr:DUF1302 family protein [Pseudomonas sp. FFUP_PS_473]MEE3635928.1 DUF1302 family protein [Pseudomonas sp. AL 58]PLP95132.1 hypothetical protein CYD26_04575 [Pseudomonas sp. FFUP_PS_473]WJM95660.1 DUF1302 family protein [Pseudomonas defluvii]
MSTLNPAALNAANGTRRHCLLAVAVALASGTASAGPTIELGENTTLDSSLTVNYTASVRTAKPAQQYLNDLNNDDGTRNFDRGSMINNRVSLFGELLLKHDNLGAVLRGSHFYDDVYHERNDNDSPDTVNKIGRANGFSEDTRRLSGSKARLLDAYVYGNFDVADSQYLSVKAGRHLVAWGESLFWPNISQGQAPVDATKFNVPGTEAKDSYLPVGQVSASWSLNEDLALVGYYQYEWEKTQLNPVGDYFGSDYFGPGAEFFRLNAGVINSLPDKTFTGVNYAGEVDARDSGQWGLGARYRLTENTEVGLFHYRYHERVGSIFFDFSGSTQYSSLKSIGERSNTAVAPAYRLGYFEDVELTGISFSSKIGDSVQYAGDLSYRDGASVYLNNGAPTTGQLWQANLNATYILGPSFLAQQTTFLGEVVHQRIEGVDTLVVSGGGPGIDGTFNQFESNTQTRGSTLLGVGAYMDYPAISDGLDLTTKVVWTQNVDGSAYQGLGRDEKRLTVGGDFKYLGNFQVGLTYVAYLSSPDVAQGRLLADRDYLSFNAKYTF